MLTIIATQLNWDGKGAERSFEYHVWPSEYQLKMSDIRRAFNMASTRVEVRENGITRTVWSPR